MGIGRPPVVLAKAKTRRRLLPVTLAPFLLSSPSFSDPSGGGQFGPPEGNGWRRRWPSRRHARTYPTAPWPGTSWGLSFFSSHAAPFWSGKPRRRARRDGGAAVAPLAGARVRPEPRAALSSGTSVVPFGGRARALRGASGGMRGVGPFFPARRRWLTGGPAPLEVSVGKEPAPPLSWLGLGFAVL